jgi:hypothetical protein
MRDLFLSASQVVTEVAQAHKPTVSLIIASFFTSLVNFFGAIPTTAIGQVGGVVTIIVGVCLANYHRKNAVKTDLESAKLILENRILQLQIEREEAAAAQRRRKEDMQREDLTPEA